MENDLENDALDTRVKTLEAEVARLKHLLDRESARAAELQKVRDFEKSENRAKSEFLANMSHELRTPLSAVIGFAELLMDMDLGEEPYACVKLLKQSGDGLLLLINNILDFSKIESQQISLDKIGFDLRVLVEDVASLLAIQAEQKGLEMACLVDKALPAQVVGDPQYIRQVLVNLVGNAIKFTQSGEVFIEVKCLTGDKESCSEKALCLEFSVTDTGIGISPEKQTQIFKRFSQAEASTTRRFGGTGLGLTISKELVAVMGGRLNVESRPDRGSRFWFRLELTPGQAVAKEAARPGLPVELAGTRVLVADANATYRKILEDMLAEMGCRVTVVADGTNALETLEQAAAHDTGFDLLIMELTLAGLDGYELARAVHQSPQLQGVQRIVLTSMTRGRQARRMRKLGCRGYLTKPVRKAILQEVITAVLGEDKNDGANLSLVTKHSVAEQKFRNIHILVADDYELNRRLVESYLKSDGFSVHLVDDGAKAVNAFRRSHFDIILMDMQMPGMDGVSAVKKIREIEILEKEVTGGRTIPIVAMTADTSQDARDRCLASGMDAFVTKPLSLKKLRAQIEKLLAVKPATGGPDDRQPPAVAVPDDRLPAASGKTPINLKRALHTAMGDTDFLKELLEMFTETTAQQLGDIKNAAAAGASATAEKFAHKIKGAAANLDIEDIRVTAMDLEQAARQEDIPGIEHMTQMLQVQLETLTDFLNANLHAQS
jgi:signal transduction histidine kinase/DNA-binding response OmpR family regulator